ncbi:unnamed protein product [Penicillium camemberti]|uniref:Str. FM013 n=1 Tax=Penicillium camemberti (strain FM 013) TaxID=1429867 RepID=A0A0G4PL58_PENC3|nr:unnamed protein product [Penicillium camemberti]
MACYSAAGFTWGATMGTSAPASVIDSQIGKKKDSFPISVLTDAIAYMYAPTSNYD